MIRTAAEKKGLQHAAQLNLASQTGVPFKGKITGQGASRWEHYNVSEEYWAAAASDADRSTAAAHDANLDPEASAEVLQLAGDRARSELVVRAKHVRASRLRG
eukprot:CAMPEP_0171235604 /NCGR_PEP_ID=MMETSP0790-20130122/42027_1 /TAXON_ID=2925 /ORGANISM="Alexandrium catenella, Strain OF101" /LENGTH=102 /DNA_ID=CAMNT_0011701911 /DNA_START=25 /DNA_END=330 /DNA_ORIENTATION=-